VRVVPSGFEDFHSDTRFDLIYAAQAWHWVDQERGFAHARSLLREGGLLAMFWNRPLRDGSALERELDEVYERLQPSLHVKAHLSETDFVAEVRAAGVFTDVELREYPWTERRSAQDWVRLIGTYSDHRMLPDDARAELQGEVAAVIERHGGVIEAPHVAKLYLAR
jgi:SAM-dependent methyltransferase